MNLTQLLILLLQLMSMGKVSELSGDNKFSQIQPEIYLGRIEQNRSAYDRFEGIN